MRTRALTGLFAVAFLSAVVPSAPAQEQEPRGSRRPGPPIFVRFDRPSATPIWKVEVESDPLKTTAAARDDALQKAARRLAEYVQDHHPNFRWRDHDADNPERRYRWLVDFIEESRVISQSRDETQRIAAAPDAPVMVRHKLELELRPAQMISLLDEDRRERSIERLWVAGRGLGGLVIVLLAFIGYVRLEDWTKGYLSLPLKLIALAIALGGSALVWLFG